MPFDVETNISAAQLRKKNKYAYFLRDVTSLTPTVTPFEVATRGYVSTQNRDRLKLLHKVCKRNVKLKTFIENLSALAVNSSYYMFVCRKEPVFSDPPHSLHLSPHHNPSVQCSPSLSGPIWPVMCVYPFEMQQQRCGPSG